jgi:Arc/MetJ family transcription regulator
MELLRECQASDSWQLLPGYVRLDTFIRMPAPVSKAPERCASREGKVRKEFWLDPETLRRAQTILGTATERETVEAALDMIAFRRELLDGLQALSGLQIDSVR